MMAMAHMLVAGAIVSRVQNPLLAYPLVLGSHFLLDSIPHWDLGTNWRKRTKWATGALAIADTVFGFVLTYALYSPTIHATLLVPILIFSVIPDWLEAPWYIFFANPSRKGPKPHASFWEKASYSVYKITNKAHTKSSFPWGIITQLITVSFFLLVLQ